MCISNLVALVKFHVLALKRFGIFSHLILHFKRNESTLLQKQNLDITGEEIDNAYASTSSHMDGTLSLRKAQVLVAQKFTRKYNILLLGG